MLNDFRNVDVIWDKATKNFVKKIRVASSDERGRKLTVQVVNGGQVENLTGSTLSLYWITENKEHQGLDVFTPIDVDNGIFELYFSARMLSNIGKLTAYLYLIDTTGATTSEPFSITVFEGIDAEAVTSEAELTTLTQALVQVQDLKQTWNDKWQNLQDQINAARNLVSDLTSLIDITGDFTLSEGVTSFHASKLGHLRFIRFDYKPTVTGFNEYVISTSKHKPLTITPVTVATTNKALDSAKGISSYFNSNGNLIVVTPEVPEFKMMFSCMYLT